MTTEVKGFLGERSINHVIEESSCGFNLGSETPRDEFSIHDENGTIKYFAGSGVSFTINKEKVAVRSGELHPGDRVFASAQDGHGCINAWVLKEPPKPLSTIQKKVQQTIKNVRYQIADWIYPG